MMTRSTSPLKMFAGGGPVRRFLDPGMLKSALEQMRAEREFANTIQRAGVTDPMSALVAIRAQTQAGLGDAFLAQREAQQAAQQAAAPVSPSRRKFLKDTAALTARQAMPLGNVAETLLSPGASMIAKTAAQALKPEIPDASIQAATAAAIQDFFRSKIARRVGEEGIGWNLGVMHEPEALRTMLLEEGVFSPTEIQQLEQSLQSLTPQAIAQKSGLPIEAVEGFYKKHGREPVELLPDWFDAPGQIDNLLDAGAREVYESMGLSRFPSMEDPERRKHLIDLLQEEIRKVPPGTHPDLKEEKLFEIAMDYIFEQHLQDHYDEQLGMYHKLLGPENFKKMLEEEWSPGNPELAFRTGYDLPAEEGYDWPSDDVGEWAAELLDEAMKAFKP